MNLPIPVRYRSRAWFAGADLIGAMTRSLPLPPDGFLPVDRVIAIAELVTAMSVPVLGEDKEWPHAKTEHMLDARLDVEVEIDSQGFEVQRFTKLHQIAVFPDDNLWLLMQPTDCGESSILELPLDTIRTVTYSVTATEGFDWS